MGITSAGLHYRAGLWLTGSWPRYDEAEEFWPPGVQGQIGEGELRSISLYHQVLFQAGPLMSLGIGCLGNAVLTQPERVFKMCIIIYRKWRKIYI